MSFFTDTLEHGLDEYERSKTLDMSSVKLFYGCKSHGNCVIKNRGDLIRVGVASALGYYTLRFIFMGPPIRAGVFKHALRRPPVAAINAVNTTSLQLSKLHTGNVLDV